MKKLPNVTLLGIDCLDVVRAQRALDISSLDIAFGAAKLLTSLPTNDVRKVAIEPLLSIDAYSEFCLTKLHQYVDTPYVLIVQHDGFVLNADAWSDTFFQYDYLGAPIELEERAIIKHGIPQAGIGTLLVGNGGFSLRSKKLLELTAHLATEGLLATNEPEDWAQCFTGRKLLEQHGISFAPVAMAETFSFEGRNATNFTWQGSFGFHSLQFTDISSWLRQHPRYGVGITNNVSAQSFLDT